MQIQKKIALAYFRWTQKQFQRPQLQSPQQDLFLFKDVLPDRIDIFDFKNLSKQIGSYDYSQALFDELAKREESFAQRNIQILLPEDPEYPANLKVKADKKPVLCVQGSLPREGGFLTVVGTRVPSLESLRWMRMELALALKKQKIVLISGAARGVDQEAHEIALANDIPTLAFLPCGIDYIYPDSFLRLRPFILDQGGAVISGFAPWEKMRKSFFHQRNVWMVAMSHAVLVVEAKRGGGSWMTGSLALKSSITTGIVPVHPLSSWGLGNNDLLRDSPAAPIRDSQDIRDLLPSATQKISHDEKQDID